MRKGWFGGAVLGSLVLGLTGAAQAAEQVVIELGPFSRSVPVEALVDFVEGEPNADLAPLLRRLTPEQQEGLRTGLAASREVDLVPLTQWFYDPMGERSLSFLGKVIRTEGRINGQRALRAALIASAAEDDTLSLLSVIRHFPTGALHLDLAQLLRNAEQVIEETEVTHTTLEAIRAQSQQAASAQPLTLTDLPDITQPGPYGSRHISLQLTDASRNRTYPVEVVLPQAWGRLPDSVPVVVISHGLGDHPQSFLDIAAHVASYGFAVALPEHIGSNFTQQQALLNGLAQESFSPQEFIDRPLDITFLLDELSRRNATDFGGNLDIDRVAVVGHSFGGYTALALGGATIDFERLAQRCDPNANILADVAMLLECRALELRQQPEVVQRLGQTGVQDDRVKVVMAFATVSNLFGPTGMARIQRPVVIFGGALDIVAPVVPQQVSAFHWLTTPDRYLYLADNTSHSPSFTRSISQLLTFDQELSQGVDEALGITRGVNKSLIVAFSQVYVAERQEFSPFLESAYVEAVSAEPFRIHQVRALPPGLGELLDETP